jgi:hypothetical protein
VLVVTLDVGTHFYWRIEGWSLLDAFLNAVARAAVERRGENRGALVRRKRPPEDG